MAVQESLTPQPFFFKFIMCDAADKVRHTDIKALLAEGRDDLKYTKHRWLMNPQKNSRKLWRDLQGAVRE